MNALMGFVADAIVDAIPSFDLDAESQSRTLRAFNKLLRIQNDLITRHFRNLMRLPYSQSCLDCPRFQSVTDVSEPREHHQRLSHAVTRASSFQDARGRRYSIPPIAKLARSERLAGSGTVTVSV